MRSIVLNVTIKFSEDISDDKQIIEVTGNVLAALVNEVEEYGIAPENSDAITLSIEVSEPFTETTLAFDTAAHMMAKSNPENL
jgi:hypothetical protein